MSWACSDVRAACVCVHCTTQLSYYTTLNKLVCCIRPTGVESAKRLKTPKTLHTNSWASLITVINSEVINTKCDVTGGWLPTWEWRGSPGADVMLRGNTSSTDQSRGEVWWSPAHWWDNDRWYGKHVNRSRTGGQWDILYPGQTTARQWTDSRNPCREFPQGQIERFSFLNTFISSLQKIASSPSMSGKWAFHGYSPKSVMKNVPITKSSNKASRNLITFQGNRKYTNFTNFVSRQ